MELKFFYCKKCGKIISILEDTNLSTVCCGEDMSELIAGDTDASMEKHVPFIQKNGNVVKVHVGEVTHPSEEKHYIQWIILQTDKGIQQKWLSPGQIPEATFIIGDDEKVLKAYEYCNIHKLWKSEKIN